MQPVNPDPALIGPRNHRQQSPTMRYEPSSLLLGRDGFVRDKHQMALRTSGQGQQVAWGHFCRIGVNPAW